MKKYYAALCVLPLTITACFGKKVPITKPVDETRIVVYNAESEYYKALTEYSVLSETYCRDYYYEEPDWDPTKPQHDMQQYCNKKVTYVKDIAHRKLLSYDIRYSLSRFTWSNLSEGVDPKVKNFIVEISYEHKVHSVPPTSIGNVTPIGEMRRLYDRNKSELRDYTMALIDGKWYIKDIIITPVQGGFENE